MIRVIIADDHPVVLAGISREVAQNDKFQVAGEAANSTELVKLLESAACDVVVTDYSMPGGRFGDGLTMLQMLRRRYPDTRIVVMTMLDNPALIRSIQKAGVSAILSKGDKLSHVAPAIQAAFGGTTYFPKSVWDVLNADGPLNQQDEVRLSKRELEVLRLCASGMPIVEIARNANRSSKTISAQKSVAMKKLGLNNDHDLYQYAVATGLLSQVQ